MTTEEERELFLHWKRTGDRVALEKIVRSVWALAVKVIRKYSRYPGYSFEDLETEAFFGILAGLKWYRPEKKTRIPYFIKNHIREKVGKYVRANCHLIKGPRSDDERTCLLKLSDAKERRGITAIYNKKDAEAIRKELGLGMSAQTLMDADVFLRSSYMFPLELLDPQTTSNVRSRRHFYRRTSLEAAEESPEDAVIKKNQEAYFGNILAKAIESLRSDRDKSIFRERRLSEERTELSVLGSRYGISSERVRQIEAESFEAVKKFVLTHSRHAGAPHF